MPTELSPMALSVLWLLHMQPMHPYEMRQRMGDWGVDRVVRVTHGALYHAVDRLQRRELIEPVETSRAGRRPERTVYAITEAGREVAHSQVGGAISDLATEYPAFRSALSFVNLLTPQEARDRLGMRAVYLQSELAAMQTACDALLAKGLNRVQLIESDHAIAVARAELELTRTLMDDIQSGRLTWTPQTIEHDRKDPDHAPAER